jgi:hypothetical protein
MESCGPKISGQPTRPELRVINVPLTGRKACPCSESRELQEQAARAISESLNIPQKVSSPLCRNRPSGAPSRQSGEEDETSGRQLSTRAHVLVDENNSDVLPTRKVFESVLNGSRRRLWMTRSDDLNDKKQVSHVL